jgi:hypothetical protein
VKWQETVAVVILKCEHDGTVFKIWDSLVSEEREYREYSVVVYPPGGGCRGLGKHATLEAAKDAAERFAGMVSGVLADPGLLDGEVS